MISEQKTNKRILTIRVAKNTLSFSMTDPANIAEPVTFEPFVVKSGISMAANMREALKNRQQTTDIGSCRLLIDSKVLMVPVERFQENEAETLYRHAYPMSEQNSMVYFNILPELNAVSVFCLNKDLRMVIKDNFGDSVRVIHVMSPVWRHLHQRSFTGHRNKLYGYFHDKQLEIFSYQQNRFKFCNSFETSRAHDSLYFLLYVWKQLNLHP